MTGPQFATNAVVHSASRHGGVFVLRAMAGRNRLRIEVEDAGGPWLHGPNDDGRPPGFDVVSALAGAGNRGIDGDADGRRLGLARAVTPVIFSPPGDAARVFCFLAGHPQWFRAAPPPR